MPLALEARNITKRFPGVLANDKVNFQLEKGEIHALLGENGAGKTTLMNILYGLYKADEGDILVNDQPIAMGDSTDAIQHGIGMVHQHFMLVPVMTVAENVMLGAEEATRRTAWLGPLSHLNISAVEERIRALSTRYGLTVDPSASVQMLPVGVQQRVEIIKVLYRDAHILILDEPTAVLTPQEAQDMFKIMRSLVDQGVSIIFITHKLKEVLAIADRITVMRAGRVVGSTTPAKTTESQLAAMMVGREVILEVEKGEAKPGAPVLKVEQLSVLDDRKTQAVRGVSFEVHTGEVLGIAGVQGNGQTELVEAITGLRKAESGHIHLGEDDQVNHSPRQIFEHGTAHVPEDRQKHGLVLTYSVRDNLALISYYHAPFSKSGIIEEEFIARNATKLIAEFDIRTPSPDTLVQTLSGGNQQKVIVARELNRPVKLLVAAQPTRGLDVGSIEFIHHRIIESRDAGCAVLLVSAELDEVLALSDRVAVMYKGEILDILPIQEATRERVGLLMAGVHEQR
ncbi:ABC transporter ATP-binding protein [Candidatus Amarolinea aalborgensis]|uniref:ABC transporter ATP-binding protein n=1 Tax=Candidatus Amarolinea aalborgensis TaxID=2249329 RepID=UPI003BFA1EF0